MNRKLHLQEDLVVNTWNTVPDTVHLLPQLCLFPYREMLYMADGNSLKKKIQIDNACANLNMHQFKDSFSLKDKYCSYSIGQRRK